MRNEETRNPVQPPSSTRTELSRQWDLIRRLHDVASNVHLEDQPGLRRCLGCMRPVFAPLEPCPACGGRPVGLRLVASYSGRDVPMLRANAQVARIRLVLKRSLQVLWALFALYLLYLFLTETLIVFLFYGVLAGSGTIVVHASFVILARALVHHVVSPGLAVEDETLEKLENRLQEAADRLVAPFFDRNRIAASARVEVPEEELRLLGAAFAAEKLEPPPRETLLSFLGACALRRDFMAFRKRIESTMESEKLAEPIKAYVRFVTAAEDPAQVPFLRQLLADRSENALPLHVGSELARARDELKLRGFLVDLEQRRQASERPASP